MDIDVQKLQTKGIMIAMPCYGGMMSGYTARCLMDLTIVLTKLGIPFQTFFLYSESLITRARNYAADEFMRSSMSHLMFIDSDIVFDPRDVLALLQVSLEDDKDVVCGPYPKKLISWEKVKKAVDMGLVDPPKSPELLSSFAGDFNIGLPANSPQEISVNLNSPLEVGEAATGFMMIKRETFEKWQAAYPDQKYFPDHKRSESFQGDKEIFAYFMDPIVNGRHLSEDYYFCHSTRDAGMKVWICPWMKIHHFGNHLYVGNLPALLSSNMSATIDPKDIRKKTP